MAFKIVLACVCVAITSAWPIDPNFKVPNTTEWLVDADASDLLPVDPETFSIDWRTKGAVSAVKSQCGGTCWSFSATGNMEGALAAAGHGLVSLSEQFLQDGCSGSGSGPYGIPIKGAQTDGKAPSEAQYPTTKAGTPGCGKKACAKTSYSAQINKAECLKNKGPESDILKWLQRGPVGISIAAGGLGSGKGILGRDAGNCSASQLNHAVLIVGYGIDNDGTKYWIMKNSWGTGFGESGFWRMKYGVNCLHLADGGPCQVTSVGGGPSPSPSPPPSPPPSPSSKWTTIVDKQIQPLCSSAEYKGDLGETSSLGDCLTAAKGHAEADYAVWRADTGGNRHCHICDVSGRGASTTWQYADLAGAVSFTRSQRLSTVVV